MARKPSSAHEYGLRWCRAHTALVGDPHWCTHHWVTMEALFTIEWGCDTPNVVGGGGRTTMYCDRKPVGLPSKGGVQGFPQGPGGDAARVQPPLRYHGGLL